MGVETVTHKVVIASCNADSIGVSMSESRAGDRLRPFALSSTSIAVVRFTLPLATAEEYSKYRLLHSSTCGCDANDQLRATVQLDIFLRAEQDAGSLSHPGILLSGRIVG